MNPEEKQALETAIQFYVETGTLNRVCQSVQSFLGRVPIKMSARRLKTLIEQHGEEIAAMAGAKSVVYIPGRYNASGRGVFGRRGGGDRATTIKPSIKFVV